jgi:phosphoglucosamine mutase
VINDSFAFRLGWAAARWLGSRGTVLIGRDTRASGFALENAMAKGLRAGGANAVSLGVLPTPAVARAVVRSNAALGVVITASHNPAEDNGIKFFGPQGVKLTDEEELGIEAQLRDEPTPTESPVAIERLQGAVDDYVSAATALLAPNALAGWKIILDTANGATSTTSAVVFRKLGADVIGIGDQPDGTNINLGVGSEHPEKLSERVRAEAARLGVAHDGDGDRCVLCDEAGGVLDGDEIMAILATHALKTGKLVRGTLVTTVQSNLGLDAAVVAAGGRICRTAVGDRYVIERMLQEGAVLGGESSGHIICTECSPTGDGLVAALKVIEVMLATGRPLSELRGTLKKFPQQSVALLVREKKPLPSLLQLTRAIHELENELGAAGRVLVRYSGTEAKLRLLVEGATAKIVADGLAKLERAARLELDVQ